MAYSLTVTECKIQYSDNTTVTVQKCPIKIALQGESLPNQNTSSMDCFKNDSCHFEVFSPVLKKWTYLGVVLEHVENVTNVSVTVDFAQKSEFSLYELGHEKTCF